MADRYQVRHVVVDTTEFDDEGNEKIVSHAGMSLAAMEETASYRSEKDREDGEEKE